MDEPKGSEETSSTKSSEATSLGTQASEPSNPETPRSPFVEGKMEYSTQNAEIKDCDTSAVQDSADPSMDQRTAVSLENSDKRGHRGEHNLIDGSQATRSTDNSKEDPSNMPQKSEVASVNTTDVKKNDCNTSSEAIKPEGVFSRLVDELNLPTKLSVPSGASVNVGTFNDNKGLVDTAAPFESVKEAVTKFGGIVDWKAHKALTLERHKQVQLELEKAREELPECKKLSEAAEDAKAQVLKELDSTKRLVEELKLNLEKAQTEEVQARQDSELAQLRVKEMEQGIANDESVAAKQQLEVAKARHAAAITELKSVKDELQAMREDYVTLVKERDFAVRRAEEAVSISKDIEKTVEDLTLELLTAKEALESAHTAHMEAEEHRIGAVLAKEQDSLNWERELKQAEEEVRRLNEQLLSVNDLRSKLETASTLLLNLKGELAAYMEEKLNEESGSIEEGENQNGDTVERKRTHATIQAEIASLKKELEEVNINIEKAKEEVNFLRVASVSLKSELESEKAALATMRQREGMASIAVSSLEAELGRTKTELELVQMKEKEAREQMVELPKALQQAAVEADRAKSVAQIAHEELRKAKEEAEQAAASAAIVESRLHAAVKEIEAAKASEKLALAAVKALEESEQAASMGGEDSPSGVTLPLDEYYILSKRAHEAEELANERVADAISQVELAKESELRSLEALEEANKEMEDKKEALRVALEKAEKAKEGKLGVEQELRKWRAEHEQRRKVSDAARSIAPPDSSPRRSFEGSKYTKSSHHEPEVSVADYSAMNPSKMYLSENDMDSVIPDLKAKKKKKSFFPRIVMFLARKKAQSAK